MKAICFISLFLTLFISNEYKLIKTVSVNGNLFKTDLLENIYIINSQNIIKYNSNGEKLYTYNNNLGNISYVDVSDPLKILVFYNEFNQIIFLDKTLSIIGSPILLDNLELDQIELACSSNTGGFWVYNSQTNQIKLINNNLQVKLQSVSINSILSTNTRPNYMIEKNDYIYLNIPESGIIIFDKFGTYNKIIPIKNLNAFQIFNNNIIYYKNNKLFSFEVEKLIEKSIDIPDTSNVKDVRIEQNKLYILKDKELAIYQEK